MAMAFLMATQGMRVLEECRKWYMEMKWKRVHRYIVFKIDESTRTVKVDKLGAPGEGYAELAASLPPDDCRYAVLDFDFVTADRCRKSKIFFIASNPSILLYRSPSASRIRAKMLYATSKQGLRTALEGVHYDMQVTDPSEMGIEIIRDTAK